MMRVATRVMTTPCTANPHCLKNEIVRPVKMLVPSRVAPCHVGHREVSLALKELLTQADRAFYAAKHNGRNQVCHANSLAQTPPLTAAFKHADIRAIKRSSAGTRTKKRGVSRETPLSTAGDRLRDQSLKRPRTPTRLPPPRFSLPPLRGWAGRALLPRSP